MKKTRRKLMASTRVSWGGRGLWVPPKRCLGAGGGGAPMGAPDPPVSPQQPNIKQKFVALLKRFKVSEEVGAPVGAAGGHPGDRVTWGGTG